MLMFRDGERQRRCAEKDRREAISTIAGNDSIHRCFLTGLRIPEYDTVILGTVMVLCSRLAETLLGLNWPDVVV